MLQALDINCILINSNVKLFEEEHPEWTTTEKKKKKFPGWTQVDLIWVAFFFLFVFVLCLFMQGHNVTDERVL